VCDDESGAAYDHGFERLLQGSTTCTMGEKLSSERGRATTCTSRSLTLSSELVASSSSTNVGRRTTARAIASLPDRIKEKRQAF
jgi:hypothetical protein